MSPQLATTIEPSDTVPSHWTLVPLQSWSLFLVCNPTWLGSGNAEKIHALYEQFQTFGRAIGPRHMAVWFWKRRRSDPSTFNEFLASQTKKTLWRQETVAEIVARTLDVDRHVAYCEKHGLLPGDSPHVLVTTTYPEEEKLENKVVIRLARADAAEITALLTKIADQLLVEGLSQEAIDTEQYWQSWLRGLRAAVRPVTALMERIAITVDTKFVKAELKAE
ncbi:MAG TPA: hypothetical protein VIG57_14910 [Candidatus Entotheonella sp.]|jgi:hypothetical protein